MTLVPLRFGIPDVDLHGIRGAKIDPCDFAGHKLVVFFCPSEAEAAAAEIEAFDKRAEVFAEADAWLIGVVGEKAENLPPGVVDATHIALADDPDGAAWSAFESLLQDAQQSDKAGGGTFVFWRSGGLCNAWPGTGHAEDALKAVVGRT